MKFAIIDNETQKVLNIIEWDGSSDWESGSNTITVDIKDLRIEIGDQYDGEKFTKTVKPAPPEDIVDVVKDFIGLSTLTAQQKKELSEKLETL